VNLVGLLYRPNL